ncbi:C25 family cysteine peptidase [Chloroflexota bacterium]
MLNNFPISDKHMKHPINFHPSKPWPRDNLIPILKTALWVKEFRFARQTALQWLTSFPGDMPVELIHGQALLGEGHIKQARRVAKKLWDRDPEYTEAQELLLNTGDSVESNANSNVIALGKKNISNKPGIENHLREAREALQAKNLPVAEIHIQQALVDEPESSLTALTHLRIIASRPDTPRQAVHSLAKHFHLRWPECVQFMLLLADSLIDSGDSEQAVAILHQAASFDITGQVIERLWGPNHPYINLWPTKLNAVVNNPIPASVKAVLGWNLLDANIPYLGEDSSEGFGSEPITIVGDLQKSETPIVEKSGMETDINVENQPGDSANPSNDLPETLRSVKAELESVGERLNKPAIAHSDGRYPTYIVFTTRHGLQDKYSRAGFAMLDAAMQELAEVIRSRPEWGAIVYYADDPACAAEMGLKPAQAGDAWSLKLALADIDKALKKKGAMIGALLIVGGPQVVPFHNLPNPTDDPDTEVPSDNPYATRDENYFIPEWPVGRLPDESGNNPAALLGNLQSISAFHANNRTRSLYWWDQLRMWLAGLFRSTCKTTYGSFGFSAEVWRKASLEVFQQIGSPKELVTSPPINIMEKGKQTGLSFSGKLGYFNLHGLADTGEWYGQRDPSNGSPGPDYPVALRTKDVLNGGRTPEIIFSEACYGAFVHKKTIENSLALKFLASGCRAVIGSTVMSYGSISTPLNAADLLGIAFWKNINEGIPVGDALRRAKIHLAREMHKRQGYLDGEDQKTLISFVLYGDPLAYPTKNSPGFEPLVGSKRKKTLVRPLSPPPKVKTVCDRAEVQGISDPIPDEIMTHIKRVVTQYLPGLQDATVSMSHEHLECACEGHNCPTGQLGVKAQPDIKPERRVITLSKSIPTEKHMHPTYARLTLDKTGKVVKVAVSR